MTDEATTASATCASEGCTAAVSGPKARYCGECARARRGKPVKYPWDDARDAALREVWATALHKKAVKVAARRVGYPPWIVKRRAQLLGLSKPRRKEPPWSAAELEVVERHAARGAEYVRKALADAGHHRTLTAVVIKRKRTGCSGRGHGSYSLGEVAGLLGVDAKTTSRWRSLGLLSARARGTSRTPQQGGDEALVTQENLRAFVLRNAHLIDLRKVPPENHLWFIDLVSGGQAGLKPDEASRPDGSGSGTLQGRDLPG